MSKFAVISSTHIPGKKEYAWDNFKRGGYIAFNSVYRKDLSGKTEEEIIEIVKSIPRDNKREEEQRKREYLDFMSLSIGDYVAVNNTNDGLFGIGKIISGYYFKEHAHDTGSTDREDFYSHFYNVKWLITQYMERKDIVHSGEKSWVPYGIIKVYPEIPSYIKRIIKKQLGNICE